MKSEKGQAMVEFALVLPILLLLLCGIINFGWVFGNQLLAQNAAREAARYTAVHYFDSATDDDLSAAAGIVSARAPALDSPDVTLAVTGDSVTVSVKSGVRLLTPLISSVFPDGKCEVGASCTMRME